MQIVSKIFPIGMQIAQEGSHLEPHGVPSSGRLGMPRALSDNKLEEQPLQAQSEGFGANLDVPGGKFLCEFLKKNYRFGFSIAKFWMVFCLFSHDVP